MRRLLPVLVGVVIVVVGGLGLLLLFNGRDSGGIETGGEAQGPGVAETEPGDPPTSGEPGGKALRAEGDVDDATLVAALATGNVALVYGTPKPPPELVQLRDGATGPFDPELAAAGQMAFLVHRKGVAGVQALAWKRRLTVDAPSDPRLGEFIDAWLGKGQGNTG